MSLRFSVGTKLALIGLAHTITAGDCSQAARADTEIAQGMGEIAESSQQQHAGVARVTGSADTIRDGAQSGAATAEETAAAATELAAQAASMREMTSSFELGDGSDAERAHRGPAKAPRRASNGRGNARPNGSGNGNAHQHPHFSLERFS